RASRSRATGFWRRDAGKAAEVEQKHGLKFFPEAEALCCSPDIDVVFISSPDAFHLQHVLLALRYNKPVLCEKPLAMNAEECRTMLNAADQAGVKFGVAHCFRFEASVGRIKELLESGSLGRPLIARSEFHYMGTQSPRKWIADPHLACGGPIAYRWDHCIDTLRYFFSDEINQVAASSLFDNFSSSVHPSSTLPPPLSPASITFTPA